MLSVDLGGPVVDRPSGMSTTQADLALQQLVRTAQAAAGSTLPVTFLHDGRRTSTLLGVATQRPVTAASADSVLAPVQVTSPLDGATVEGPVTVTGQASAFEGNVQWELMDGARVVKRGFATTKVCCTLSPYSFTLSAPAGTYTLVVHDEDVSDGEGADGAATTSQDTKTITLR